MPMLPPLFLSSSRPRPALARRRLLPAWLTLRRRRRRRRRRQPLRSGERRQRPSDGVRTVAAGLVGGHPLLHGGFLELPSHGGGSIPLSHGPCQWAVAHPTGGSAGREGSGRRFIGNHGCWDMGMREWGEGGAEMCVLATVTKPPCTEHNRGLGWEM